jgi:hypothetical protein
VVFSDKIKTNRSDVLKNRIFNVFVKIGSVYFTIWLGRRCACPFDIHKSVHYHTIKINQTTRCNSYTSLLLDVYVWLKMFRALLRPSSGAYNSTRSLWFYRRRVAVGALLAVVWQVVACQGQQLQFLSSWWWAVCRSKHVEQLRNTGIISSTRRSHLVGYFYSICIMIQGSMKINFFQGLSRIWQETINQFKTNIKSGKWKISHPIEEKVVKYEVSFYDKTMYWAEDRTM